MTSARRRRLDGGWHAVLRVGLNEVLSGSLRGGSDEHISKRSGKSGLRFTLAEPNIQCLSCENV
ncbi:hypothetical protein LG3211_0405 [Lysobacter gummosus]|nr:hypothetical protein LG3211_0405 [Lysobacter gummosus]